MKACLTDIVAAYQMKLSTAEADVEDVTGLDAKSRDVLHTTLDELDIEKVCKVWLDENGDEGQRSIELGQFWGLLNAWYDTINANVDIKPGNRRTGGQGGGGGLCTGSEEAPQASNVP